MLLTRLKVFITIGDPNTRLQSVTMQYLLRGRYVIASCCIPNRHMYNYAKMGQLLRSIVKHEV